MKEEQRLDLQFEKYNSKQNRLWEQVTTLSIFILTSLVAYVIALVAIDKNLKAQLTISLANYVLLSIIVIVTIAMSVLSTHLVDARNHVKKICTEHHIS